MVKILLFGALAGITFLILPNCGTAEKFALEPGLTFLTHDELKALMSRTRTVRFAAGSAKGTGIYAQDGTARVDWGTGGAKGTWRINGDKFCTTYPGIRRGYETCNNLHKTGENAYTLFYSDGSLNGTWRVQP